MGPLEYAIVGEGPYILCFHGGPGGYDQSVLNFDMFADAGFSLICVSRPGYLGTPLSTGKTIPEQADAAALLLDALGIDKVYAIGASAGGPPTYEFAIRHPERTNAIVVIDGVSRTYSMPDQAGSIQQALFLSDPGLKFTLMVGDLFPRSVVAEIIRTEGRLPKEELKARISHIMSDKKKVDYVLKLFHTMYPYSQRKEGTENDLQNYSRITELPVDRITAPALIIHGTADADVDFGDGLYAAGAIRGAEHFWVEKGTHLCFWVSPEAEEAQRTAIDFLKRHQ
ncbi:MAG: alpha/beta hydrolase [Massilibacteroides sp.]|nr:alpha/beta hydrolase [Massilibacteroides sp.]